ncbi:NAD(P)-binding protein [Umbelopsis sp. PMI_123]|nr:NAD(P)-binding protein [Umbelopsis sp. PMI_123]
MSKKVGIVFGANGISGSAVVKVMLKDNEWKKIICVSRRPIQLDTNDERIQFISIDMLSSTTEELTRRLQDAGANEAHYAYFFTYIEKKDEDELIQVNKLLFEMALNATKSSAPNLKSFSLQTGMKYYGAHKGGATLAQYPWKEDAPRNQAKNFYYVQEDVLKDVSIANGWKWFVTRPNIIIGNSNASFMNLAVAVAIYATLLKELGKPLIFPGNAIEYDAVIDHSTAENTAAFQLFISTSDNIASGAYNITNGDKPSFKDLWPKIAKYFEMEISDPITFDEKAKNPAEGSYYLQFSTVDFAKANRSVWDEIVKKHALKSNGFAQATWGFLDGIAGRTWADDSCPEKTRSTGWNRSIDTLQSYFDVFDEMKKDRIIP